MEDINIRYYRVGLVALVLVVGIAGIVSAIAPTAHFYANITIADANSTYGSASNPTGNHIGGGTGYSDIKTSGTYTVTSKLELISALSTATAGDVVYVTDATTIDLTGTDPLTIPAGVTLASDRGYGGNSGALINRTLNKNGGWEEPMFIAGGNNVRVTGLRLEGEMAPQDYEGIYEKYFLVGLYANGVLNFTVDNNEMRGWSWSAVSLRQSNASVHHNYIHHNQARGEGYGTNLYGGNASIYGNLYDYNRHDITGSGLVGESYNAYYNTVIGNGNAIGACHFDVHENEDLMDNTAGDRFVIHHNTIGEGVVASVHIRGKAATGVYVYNNIVNSEATDTGVPGGLPFYMSTIPANEDNFPENIERNYWMGTLYPSSTDVYWFQSEA